MTVVRPDTRIYTFGRGVGRVVATMKGNQEVALSFALPVRSGAVINGVASDMAHTEGVGLVDTEVQTDRGAGHLTAR